MCHAQRGDSGGGGEHRTRTADGGGSCIIKAGGPGKEAGGTYLRSGKEEDTPDCKGIQRKG